MSQESPPNSQTPADPAIAPALGATVGRGAAWMIAATLGSKGFSFFAQIALGWFLLADEWGIFGIAISISFFLQVFRDGGMRQLLVQRGAAEYPSLMGPVFWMACAFNIATALLLLVAGPVAALAYNDPRLVGMLAVMAISVPLATPSIVTSARLRIELRFAELAKMAVGSAIIRYGGAVALAYAGFGAMAFVLPLPFMYLYESLYCQIKTGDKPWTARPEFKRWPELFGHGKWLIVMALAFFALDLSDYLVIGLFVPALVVGLYYFAYQLIAQTGALLAANFEQVLLPALSRLKDEADRRRQAVLRSLRAVALVSAPASLLLGALIEPLELVLWHGRWAATVPAVQTLALFYPGRAIFVVASAYMLAIGRFKAAAIMILMLGAGRMIVASIAAPLTGTAEGVAFGVGLYVAASCIIAIIWALRSAQIGTVDVLKAILPAWIIAAIAAMLAWTVDNLLRPGAPAFVSLIVSGGTGAIVFIVLARTLVPRHLEDASSALPMRIRKHAMSLIRLPGTPEPASPEVSTP